MNDCPIVPEYDPARDKTGQYPPDGYRHPSWWLTALAWLRAWCSDEFWSNHFRDCIAFRGNDRVVVVPPNQFQASFIRITARDLVAWACGVPEDNVTVRAPKGADGGES